MKFKISLILFWGIVLILSPIKSTNNQNGNQNQYQNPEGTCPGSDPTCAQKANAKLKENQNNNELEIEDIPKVQNQQQNQQINQTQNPGEPVRRYKSQKSGFKKENEPEPEDIDYPEDFEYKDLFQKYGERRKYLHSFTMDSNYTEYYDFNLDDEEIYSLLEHRITLYPPKKFASNYQGNFLHFMKIVYEKKLPLYLTTDSMLYAFNENLSNFQNIYYSEILPSYLQTFLVNVINYTEELIDSPEGSEHKYFISHAQLFFATGLELLTNGIEKIKYQQAIETPLKSFISKIQTPEVQEFFLFYNKIPIDCRHFIPDSYFSKSKGLKNLFQAIKWFQVNRFIYEPQYINPIWYIGKMIVDSGQYELYNLIYDSLKFVMGMDSLTKSLPDIYKFGVEELGYKDLYDLENEQADALFRALIKSNKEIDIPFTRGRFYYSQEEIQMAKIERELSSAVLDTHWDLEDWVKNKLIIFDPKRLRVMMSSMEIPLVMHHATHFKEYLYAKYIGKINTDSDPRVPLRDGIDIRRIVEDMRYTIKDLMTQNPERFRRQIKNGIHLLLYKASRRIKSYDPVFKKSFYKQKNFNIAYGGYIDFKKDFAIMKSILNMKKKEGGFADVVVEPNTGFYEEMLELTRAYKKIFTDLEKYGIEKMNIKKLPHLSHLNFANAKLKGMFRHLEDCIQMLLLVIKKQENGVELDEELKDLLFDIVKLDTKYNTFTGWYVTLINPNDSSDSFNFLSWSTKIITATPNEDHKFNGAIIYVNSHYPTIGLIVKEDKFKKQRKLLLFASYNTHETMKMYNPEKLNFDDEIKHINQRDYY